MNERDPITGHLLNERDPFNRRLLRERPRRYRRNGIWPTPAFYSPASPPSSDARIRAIARNRIWATTDRPISAEAQAEAMIILSVLTDCRATHDWTHWPSRARSLIAAIIPDHHE